MIGIGMKTNRRWIAGAAVLFVAVVTLGGCRQIVGSGGGGGTTGVPLDAGIDAVWARSTTTGSGSSVFTQVAVADDAVYAVGYVADDQPLSFADGVSVTGTNAGDEQSGSRNNSVIVRYSAAGDANWARTTEASPEGGLAQFGGVALVGGAVFAAGVQAPDGEYRYGPEDTAWADGPFSGGNAVIVSYDGDGTALWARTMEAAPQASGYQAIAAGGAGVVAVGYLFGEGTYDLGNEVAVAAVNSGAPSAPIQNALIVSFTAQGEPAWARSVADASAGTRFWTVAVAPDGSVYAGGSQDGDNLVDYGSGATAAGSTFTNGVLVKYDADGNPQWSVVTEASVGAIEAAANGTVIVAGGKQGLPYLAAYAPSGAKLWESVATVPGSDSPPPGGFNAVAVDPNGLIFAVGIHAGDAPRDYGNGVVVQGAHGELKSNAVFVVFGPDGTALAGLAGEGPADGSNLFTGVAATTSGALFAVGLQAADHDYSYGPDATTSGADDANNALVVRYDLTVK